MKAEKDVFGVESAGSAFHVYTPGLYRGQAKFRARAYAVAAGETVEDVWDIDGFERNIYRLCVCGPNGFLREFAGTAEDPRIDVQVEYARHKTATRQLTGDVEVRVRNLDASQPQTLQIIDAAYGDPDRSITVRPGAGKAMLLRLSKSFQWYDFRVSVNGNTHFLRRFAGRVETGKPGYSDPVMARR